MSSSEITVSHIRRRLVVYDYDFNSDSEVNSESLYESSSSHNKYVPTQYSKLISDKFPTLLMRVRQI
jgi:hypothetical protein